MVANSAFTLINFRSELIQEFQSLGYSIIALVPRECNLISNEDAKVAFSELNLSVEYISLSRSGLNPLGEIKLLLELFLLMRKYRPEIVLNYTIKPTIYSSLAAKLNKVKTVASNITGLGYVFTGASIKNRLIKFIVKLQYRLALRFNNVVYFQNPDDLELFLGMKLVSKNKSCLLKGSGVDTCFLSPKNKDYLQIKILFVGRLLQDKGIYELFDAIKKVKAIYPDLQFSIAGGLDENPSSVKREQLDSYINSGLIDYKGVLKSRKAMKELYQSHNIFILPSYREGTPRSTLEAMSMGLAVITTNVPGCRETVRNNVNGYLINDKSDDAIIGAILKLVAEPCEIKRMGENSRKLAIENFDVHAVNRRIINSLGL